MPEIHIKIREKQATLQEGEHIVCGNSDYTVVFDFDEEWGETAVKAAVFAYQRGGERRYERVLFEGDVCPVPVLRGISFVNIGVEAGNIRTTTAATVPCLRAVTDNNGMPTAPSEDIYAQILALLNDNQQELSEIAEEVADKVDKV